jgi:hypothetical protein
MVATKSLTKSVPQRLKPHGRRRPYGTAKAVPLSKAFRSDAAKGFAHVTED